MKHKARILYVEDDIYLSYVTKDNLELNGYHILCCKDGEEALEAFRSESFDLCILDVMLPKLDGFSIAKKIRETNHDIPILFLSAKSLKEDRIRGLSLGGDDYIVKPFSIEELVLKIEVFLKRSKVRITENNDDVCEIGQYRFDRQKFMLINDEESRSLTRREAELLYFLYINRNKTIPREHILNEVWGNDSYFQSRSLDVFISRLRNYLKNDPAVRINNIHNVGYIFEVG